MKSKWLSNLIGKYFWCKIGKHKRGVLIGKSVSLNKYKCPLCPATWTRKARKPKGGKNV